MPSSLAKSAPSAFAFIERQIRQDAVGTEFGADFEWLRRFFLLAAPQYKGLFKSVWLWNDWPGRWGADKGIDLIAQTTDGKLWAIQAKAVRADRSIPKSELDSFLSESNRPQFDYRLIIAMTDDIGRNARDTIAEAHHASADGLAQIVNLWRERGGQLFFFTATPYRGDGRPVKLDGMRAFRRSLAEHMAEGFAPKHLESEIAALGQPGDKITAGQFTGEEAPLGSYFEGLVAAICLWAR